MREGHVAQHVEQLDALGAELAHQQVHFHLRRRFEADHAHAVALRRVAHQTGFPGGTDRFAVDLPRETCGHEP